MRINDQEASRLKVLKAIRRLEPVARTQLAALTGLSPQAVSDLTADLLRRNLLLEERAPAAGPGRPRTLLRINAEAARAAGAFIFSDGRMAIEIINLKGERHFSWAVQLPEAGSLEALAPLIASGFAQAFEESGVPKAAIHSVGVGVPGVVDSVRGVVHWMPRYPEPPAELARAIQERIGLPVFLDSGADMLARAEHWFGPHRLVDDFTLVFVGFGIGLGEYVDGLLRTGAHGMSTAFAHVKVTAGEGPPCMCGAKGCLSSYASVAGVVRRIAEGKGLRPPRFAELNTALTTFADEARSGDGVAREAFEFAGRALGVAVANHINVLDPARLVVLVEQDAFAKQISAPFTTAVAANTLPALRGRAPVELRSVQELSFAEGAAGLVLERLYLGAAP